MAKIINKIESRSIINYFFNSNCSQHSAGALYVVEKCVGSAVQKYSVVPVKELCRKIYCDINFVNCFFVLSLRLRELPVINEGLLQKMNLCLFMTFTDSFVYMDKQNYKILL